MNKQEFKKIDISATHWVPTIVKVENGYIVSTKTPRLDADITEVYVYSSFQEVIDFLRKNFE